MFIKILKRRLFTKRQTWWEKEAEENWTTVGEYIRHLKLEKENAELEALKLKKKEDARSRREKWDDYQAEQFEKEKEKVAGYEQLAKVHSAYISIILKKLGATDRYKAISFTRAEVKEALEKNETRALIDGDGYKLYCEVIE